MTEKPLPYKPANLLTPAEEIFFNTVLNPILNDEFHISFKTKLRDLVKIEDDHKNNNYWNETDKHIDFLICNKIDPSDIRLAIELDDSSHDDEDTKLKDKEKNKILKSIGLNLLRIKVKEVYDIEGLEITIRKKLGETSLPPNKPITNWNKVKEGLKNFFWEKGIQVIGIIISIFILQKVIINSFQNWSKDIQKKLISPKPTIVTPPPILQTPPPYQNKNLTSPQTPMIVKEPQKIQVKITGKSISEDKNMYKSFVIYETPDRKQKNISAAEFMIICKCNPEELRTGMTVDIVNN